MPDEQRKQRAAKVFQRLRKEYPDARTLLDHRNAWELLMATILAAQCTDAAVNVVTKVLFKEFTRAKTLANARPAEIETIVKATGFFRQKTRSIIGASAAIMERFAGKVPGTMEELTSLPGVGRKTANVVLGEYFKSGGIIVDTHVKRVSGRIGLTRQTDPEKIEADLSELISPKDRTIFSHTIGFHGRRVCVAPKPKCPECVITELCDYYRNVQSKKAGSAK